MRTKLLSVAAAVFLLIVTAAAAATSPVQPPASADSVTFRFNPPIGKPVTETYTQTTVTESADGTQTRVVSGTSVSRFTPVEEGYLLSGEITSMKMMQDGKDVTDAVSKMMEGLQITWEIDRDGQLTAIGGYDRFAEKMVRMLAAAKPLAKESGEGSGTNEAAPENPAPLTPQQVQQIETIERSLINKDAAEWRGRIGNFAGKTARVGDVWTEKNDSPLPGGSTITFYSTTTFAGREKCGTADCVRIRFQYNSDPAAFGDAAKAILSDAPAAAVPTAITATITGTGHRLIDPATMNIHSEVTERTITMQMTLDGKAQPVKRVEKREYAYTY